MPLYAKCVSARRVYCHDVFYRSCRRLSTPEKVGVEMLSVGFSVAARSPDFAPFALDNFNFPGCPKPESHFYDQEIMHPDIAKKLTYFLVDVLEHLNTQVESCETTCLGRIAVFNPLTRQSHIRIIGPSASFRYNPVDVLRYVFDVACFAMHAILRVDLQLRRT